MKKSNPFKSRHIAAIAIALVILAQMTLLTGCAAKSSTATPAQTAVEQSSAATPSEAATESAPTAEPTMNLGPTAQKYQSKLDAYLQELPAESVNGTPAAAAGQQSLVDQMIALYTQKASSKEIFALYQSGITQLAPEQADPFTAYAISGMRRNSFEDYKPLEKFANTPANLDSFFKAAEPFKFNYLQLHRHVADIQDTAIQSLVQGAQEQGYYIASTEGMLYYLVDFSAFARYRNFNSPAMGNLLTTLAIDSLDPISADAAMIIDPWVLGARAYGMEQMLSACQGTPYEKYLATRFKDHLVMLLFGLNNTPTFSYDTGLVTPEAEALFTELQTLEGSQIAELTTQMLAIVQANGGKLNDSNRDQAMAVLDSIDTKYNLSAKDLENFGLWMSGNQDQIQTN